MKPESLESQEPIEIEKLRIRIMKHVRKWCLNLFTDPQDNRRDICSKHDCPCIATDSPYSYRDLGHTTCKLFDSLPPMEPAAEATICAYCKQPFTRTGRNQKYCSDACSEAASRKAARTRQRKHRSESTDGAA